MLLLTRTPGGCLEHWGEAGSHSPAPVLSALEGEMASPFASNLHPCERGAAGD